MFENITLIKAPCHAVEGEGQGEASLPKHLPLIEPIIPFSVIKCCVKLSGGLKHVPKSS